MTLAKTSNMRGVRQSPTNGKDVARDSEQYREREDLEKALRESDLGLNPQTQAGVIRVPLPSLNEQRRKELVKVVHKLAEEARIGIRHARTGARDQLKKLEKTSEDDQKKAEKELQKLHDDYIGRIDELLKGKEAEIMEV